MNKWNYGEVVQLKSGGFPCTVTELGSSNSLLHSDPHEVKISWCDGKTIDSTWVHEGALQIYKEEQDPTKSKIT